MLPIYILTKEQYNEVENYPVIKINFLSPVVSFDGIDYLIFTSKNGVRAIDKITNEWKKIPSFAIGKYTAKEIKKLGGNLEFISSSAYGDEFAKELISKYQNKTFLFLRAKKIISPINKIFSSSSNSLKEIIMYETICNKPKKSLNKPSIVIFTSPSTVKCFAKNNDFKNITAIAIGEKTKNILNEFIKDVSMPSYPSINECIKLAKNIKLL